MMTASGFRKTVLRLSEKVSCAAANEVLCVSSSIRDEAVSAGLCPPNKVKVLHHGSINGIDALGRFNPTLFPKEKTAELREQLGLTSDDIVIGFIGRIVRDKGWSELAGAWRTLRDKHPNLHMLVIGPLESQDPVGPEIEDLLRTDCRLHWIGEDYDVARYYAAMDILVLPTYREGFPVVPLEAASMGVPVIATRIPGCVDAVEDGKTGTLVPVRDAFALEVAIDRYIYNPELRQQHGFAARERVLRDFRQEVIWEALYQEYIRLLREKGIPVPASHAAS